MSLGLTHEADGKQCGQDRDGRLTARHQRHEKYSVSTPPSNSPIAAPLPEMAPKTPNAFARSFGSWNVTVISASAAGASRAAKTPCSARAPNSSCAFIATPPSAERRQRSPPARSGTPLAAHGRRCVPEQKEPPKANVYAVTTHCTSCGAIPRSACALGMARFTIDASSTIISCAIAITNRALEAVPGRIRVLRGLEASQPLPRTWGSVVIQSQLPRQPCAMRITSHANLKRSRDVRHRPAHHRHTVQRLPQQISVTVVPGVFGDHVQIHPTQADAVAMPVGGHEIQRQVRHSRRAATTPAWYVPRSSGHRAGSVPSKSRSGFCLRG